MERQKPPIHLGLARWVTLLTCLLVGCATTHDRWVEPAEAALARGELDAAIAYYQAAAEEAPGDLAIQTRLALLLVRQGDALAEQGRLQLAEARYTSARARGGSAVESLELLLRHADLREAIGAELDQRIEPLRSAWERYGDAQALTRLANAWDAAGNVEQARQAFAALVEREPNNSGALLRLAQLHEAAADTAAAQSDYERFLLQEPDSLVGRLSLAGIFEAQGKLPEAEALYLAVTQAQPQHAGAWRHLLAFYERSGNAEGAARAAAEIAARWPEQAQKKRPLR